jgi:hypothetical protein
MKKFNKNGIKISSMAEFYSAMTQSAAKTKTAVIEAEVEKSCFTHLSDLRKELAKGKAKAKAKAFRKKIEKRRAKRKELAPILERKKGSLKRLLSSIFGAEADRATLQKGLSLGQLQELTQEKLPALQWQGRLRKANEAYLANDGELLFVVSATASSWRTLELIAGSPATPDWLLDDLSRMDGTKALNIALTQNRNTPPSAMLRLVGKVCLSLIVEHRNTPKSVLKALYKKDPEACTVIASSLRAPAHVLRDIAHSDSCWARDAVAENPSTPTDTLEYLSRDEYSSVRCRVVSNPSTPPAVLAEMALDEDCIVRHSVAESSSVAADTLRLLATDESIMVRREAARNPLMPVDALMELAGDDDFWVRRAVVNNPSTPAEALTLLSQDEDRDIRYAVANSSNAPAEALEAVLYGADQAIIESVALNSSAPADILVRLSKSHDHGVRKSVAQNQATPSHIIEELATDKMTAVRCAVARNKATPSTLLSLLSNDRKREVRSTVAANKLTPSAVLQRLARDQYDEVRESVANNKSTPTDILRLLVDDKPWISNAAREAIAVREGTAWRGRLRDAHESYVSKRAQAYGLLEGGGLLAYSYDEVAEALLLPRGELRLTDLCWPTGGWDIAPAEDAVEVWNRSARAIGFGAAIQSGAYPAMLAFSEGEHRISWYSLVQKTRCWNPGKLERALWAAREAFGKKFPSAEGRVSWHVLGRALATVGVRSPGKAAVVARAIQLGFAWDAQARFSQARDFLVTVLSPKNGKVLKTLNDEGTEIFLIDYISKKGNIAAHWGTWKDGWRNNVGYVFEHAKCGIFRTTTQKNKWAWKEAIRAFKKKAGTGRRYFGDNI